MLLYGITKGMRNETVRERLLEEPNMTLKKAIAICKSKESSRQQARALTASGETNVHSVHSKRGRGRG